MPDLLLLLADLVAITLLVGVVYHRRHRRRDMVLAYIALNVGVFAVATVLNGLSISMGVGLGIFGVLSIIRLRSYEISQAEVAYYFAALAIGLINGLAPEPRQLAPALSALIVATIYLLDHPLIQNRQRHQVVTLDSVHRSERDIVTHLEELIQGEVLHFVVLSTDQVRDLTVVDVRYRPFYPVLGSDRAGLRAGTRRA